MRILYVTTISLTMNTFFIPHIKMLIDSGAKVDIACNYRDLPLDEEYKNLGCEIYQVDFSRSPLDPSNLKASFQLKKIVENGDYDIVHCHTPNASVITRLVCRKFRKNGLKVFYTAHGFHFYKGAPKFNWLVFYPVEKCCSRFTDKLITINHEDYNSAKSKFKAKAVYYIPGVGVDLEKFKNINVDKDKKRSEIGVPKDSFMLLSVGELNENKNHQLVIRALKELNNSDIHYVIAGSGDKKESLEKLVSDLKLDSQVHLLGYRNDVAELYAVSDAFCLPSRREGLGLVGIEAMASGLPLIASGIHGIKDYAADGITGFTAMPDDVRGFASAIKKLYDEPEIRLSMKKNCIESAQPFNIENVLKKLYEIYFAD